jgi:hypothetical protein
MNVLQSEVEPEACLIHIVAYKVCKLLVVPLEDKQLVVGSVL